MAKKISPSGRSLRGLDATNFLMADVLTGIGPFLAIYLSASLHWKPADIGLAISAAGIAGLIAQTPVGALVDRLPYKREAIALGAGLVGSVRSRLFGFTASRKSSLRRWSSGSSEHFSRPRWRG